MDGTPSVLREVQMLIDQQHLAAVDEESCDVCDEFPRLTQHRLFTSDGQLGVRFVHILFQHDVVVARRVPRREDGVECAGLIPD